MHITLLINIMNDPVVIGTTCGVLAGCASAYIAYQDEYETSKNSFKATLFGLRKIFDCVVAGCLLGALVGFATKTYSIEMHQFGKRPISIRLEAKLETMNRPDVYVD